MSHIKRFTLLAALALPFTIGCGNNVEKDLSSWSDRACACKDAACAEKEKKALDGLEKKYKDKTDDMSKKELEALKKHYKKGATCLKEHGVFAR
jgi:hypothetical protein